MSVRNAANGYLDELAADIAAEIARAGAGEAVREAVRERRLNALLKAVAAAVAASYRDLRDYHLDEMSGLAEAEALYTVKKVNELVGAGSVSVSMTAREAVSLVKDTLLTGGTLAEWWQSEARKTQEAFTQQMRIGMVNGESDAELIARVRGTKALSYQDGIMTASKRRAAILVRGASSAVTRAVREKAIEDNPRIFRGLQQISVLDGRTSTTCVAYAGKVWEVPGFKPVGHSLPYNGGTPRHPNCRSTEIAVIREEHGGAPADDVDFDTFLEGKPKEFTDQLLGKGRAELYRAGTITLSHLVDQKGRPLTLAQLKELY